MKDITDTDGEHYLPTPFYTYLKIKSNSKSSFFVKIFSSFETLFNIQSKINNLKRNAINPKLYPSVQIYWV